ncbi:MAG: phosphatase PAP2 family protein [Gemmatimonadales bacterium]|nr:phosphatase PAP2 family protein [Gemmatimonadales bacterium]
MAFANLILLTSWLPAAPRVPLAAWFTLVHLAALALPSLLARADRPLSPVTRLLREIYPLLWAAAFWSELGLRNGVLPSMSNDGLVAGWDQALFGTHLNVTWIGAMPWVPLSELMQSAYFSYYLMLAAIPIALWWTRGSEESRREIVLRVAVTYLGCFVIYSYFPVVGPRELWPIHDGELVQGFFYRLNLALRTAGDSLGTAFPSSHTAGAITFAWIATRIAPKRVATGVSILAALIAAATVYTQNHFAVDTVAGVAVAVVLQGVVVPHLLTGSMPAVAAPASSPVLVPQELSEAA